MSYKVINLERLHRELIDRLDRLNQKIIAEHIANITGDIDKNESIAIGSTAPILFEDLVKEMMKHWVKAYDLMINECLYQKLDITEPFFVMMKMRRGITFEEFQMVLKTTDYDTIHMDEKDYKHFRAYDFFKIHDRIDRKQFIMKNRYDKDNFQDYVSMLEKYNIPILSFFLQTKIPAYFPFSALLKHSYLTAGSGSGKTELMKLIAYNLQGKTQKHQNASIVLFDPQGEDSQL